MKVVSDKKCELYNREHRIVTTHTQGRYEHTSGTICNWPNNVYAISN